jgi:hypothetical protein
MVSKRGYHVRQLRKTARILDPPLISFAVAATDICHNQLRRFLRFETDEIKMPVGKFSILLEGSVKRSRPALVG